jgi:hypothetical protein
MNSMTASTLDPTAARLKGLWLAPQKTAVETPKIHTRVAERCIRARAVPSKRAEVGNDKYYTIQPLEEEERFASPIIKPIYMKECILQY